MLYNYYHISNNMADIPIFIIDGIKIFDFRLNRDEILSSKRRILKTMFNSHCNEQTNDYKTYILNCLKATINQFPTISEDGITKDNIDYMYIMGGHQLGDRSCYVVFKK